MYHDGEIFDNRVTEEFPIKRESVIDLQIGLDGQKCERG